jgi:carbon monoxide dehydrogenase subunit G
VSVVLASIDIAAPIEEVWESIIDPARIREWVTIVDSIDYVDSGEIRPGFRMDQTLHLRGVHFKVRWTLERVQAPAYARWVGTGPARSTATTEYRLSARDGHTRFDYCNEFRTPFGPLGAAASRVIVGGIPEKEANASLRRLKEILENRC